MKKHIAFVTAHIIAFTCILVGFGLINTTENQSAQEKFTGILEQGAVLRILENDTAIEQGYLDELLSAFNLKYAEYGITAIDANMDQRLDLENDGPYGYGPDVLYQANDSLMHYVDGKHILPLPADSLECYSQISQSAWDAYTMEVEGEKYIFGVPVNIQSSLIYYRKDLLPDNWQDDWDDDKNGVPDMLESWNAMYKFSLQRKTQGKFGYMKSLFDPYFAVGYLFSYGAYVFGQDGKDVSDIGFSGGESEKGANVLKQLASVMNEWCIDDTITRNAYTRLASGEYFATMTTPDVYTLFIDELINAGMSEEEAVENLGVADIPMLPQSGDLTEQNPQLTVSKMMGGINGYAISAYTKAPNAALAFVNFATSYDMVKRRNALLGIAPARADVVEEIGGLSEIINRNMAEGNISVMPSVRAMAQVWTPVQTFFTDIARDAYRNAGEQKYTTAQSMKDALKKVDKQIYDAIHTLQG